MFFFFFFHLALLAVVTPLLLLQPMARTLMLGFRFGIGLDWDHAASLERSYSSFTILSMSERYHQLLRVFRRFAWWLLNTRTLVRMVDRSADHYTVGALYWALATPPSWVNCNPRIGLFEGSLAWSSPIQSQVCYHIHIYILIYTWPELAACYLAIFRSAGEFFFEKRRELVG